MAINKKMVRKAAIEGNAIYFLWTLWNVYKVGFKVIGTVQGVSRLSLLLLLGFNIILLNYSLLPGETKQE